MAQYSPDQEGEDYSDIGDVHSSINFAEICDEDVNHEAIKSSVVPPVPVSGSSEISRSSKKPAENSLAVMKRLADGLGIPISVSMENQIRAISATEGDISEDNLKWYLRGFITCQASSTVPAMREVTAELRSEVKRMQISTNEINKSGKAVEKASAKLLTEIESSAAITRSIFDEALKNISDYVMSTMDSLKDQKIKASRPLTAEEALISTIVSVPTLPDDNVREATVKKDIKIPEVVVSPQDVGTSKTATVAKEDDAIAPRKLLLSTLGYPSVFIKELTPELMMSAVPPNLLAEVKGQKITQRVKLTLKDIIRANLIKATSK
ncbi:phosphoprotein [Kenyan potato cytorhabdovirus]|uniref:Phosphoprotein n=1 Tax=Kenyan potato cytorhabdovirus TaxID=2801326 RepID=A0A7T7FQW7_9RHAB|nr:phosphoprotein [Kenyan potato cytorhabdovirus]QQL94319.1 phosphoprotein [Kenyan potato cytorhabdovirus]